MNLATSQTHDIFGRNSAHGKRVADQRTMTAPGHRFGAHNGNAILFREPDQLLEVFLELGGLHVIGIATKRGIAPTGVDRIGSGMAQSAEPRDMDISQTGLAQRSGSESLLNCGLCWERGIVRTSATKETS